jgi:hypothetical protein
MKIAKYEHIQHNLSSAFPSQRNPSSPVGQRASVPSAEAEATVLGQDRQSRLPAKPLLSPAAF